MIPGIEETNFLNVAFSILTVGVIVSDVDGHVIFFNTEAERILGIGAMGTDSAAWSVTYGCYRADRVTPYPAEELPLARAIRGEDALHQLIFIRNPQRLAGLWIDASGKALRDSSGRVCGGVVVFSDISVPENLLRAAIAVEASLKSARNPSDFVENQHTLVSERFGRLRTLYEELAIAVEQTADGILITDSRGIIEYVNPAFEKITEFSAEEVLGRRPNVLKSGSHNAEFYRGLWSKLITGDSFKGTIINRKKSGELFWSAQTITPIKDQAGVTTHFVSVLKDLTALRKKQEQEFHMALAQKLQQRYYNTTASLPGFDIAAAAYPADETGGDYFDFIPQLDGSLYIVVADIAGHGLGAALLMAEVRASVRAHATMVLDVPSLLDCVNRSLVESCGGDRFVTMFLGRIDPQTRSLEYVSAGHESGYLLRSSGDVATVLASTAMPLGIFPDQQFCLAREVPLEQGNTLLLLTDGIKETTDVDGAVFGIEGALNFIRSRPQGTAAELVHGLYNAARTFAGAAPQNDDMLTVICKIE